jgi:signal transduction histidine kinase
VQSDPCGGSTQARAPVSPRVLVVDDDARILEASRRSLVKHGYAVEVVSDGESALLTLGRSVFDVVLSDVEMPQMTGLELCARIRAIGIDVPVVLVSGNLQFETATKAMEQGVARYLVKPVLPTALVRTVGEVIRLHGLARAERLAEDNLALRSVVDALRRSKDAALAGERAKDVFLSKMSHELRTPMTTVLGMTELVLASALTPEQREGLLAVRDAASSLMSTIAGVLDLADLEGRRLRLETKAFDPGLVVERAVKGLRSRAEAKGLLFQFDREGEDAGSVLGDAARFEQVVFCLLDNAIKFTDRGAVKVCVRNEQDGDTAAAVSVVVSDSGVGMAPGTLPLAIEAFAQLDDSSTRRHAGAGLGLSIASALVTLMGGKLELDSAAGSGTTAKFVIGFEREAPEASFFTVDEYRD